MLIVSNRVHAAANSFEPIRHFYFHSRYAERRSEPDITDFTFGNPHEMPLPGLVQAIQHHAVPLNEDWFAYKTSEPEPQAFVAERLSEELSLPFEPADIALTNGALPRSALPSACCSMPGRRRSSRYLHSSATNPCC